MLSRCCCSSSLARPTVLVLLLLASQPAVSDTHKAVGYTNPWDPALTKLAQQSALVRVSTDESAWSQCGRGFVGLSYDLEDVEEVASRDYMALLRRLTAFDTGAMTMRIGAITADRMKGVWSTAQTTALRIINKWTGTQFILGVNMHAEDPQITKMQVKHLRDRLPPGAIVSFAVGNEPNMYSLMPKGDFPGSRLPKPSTWLNDQWIPVSRKVYKPVAEGKRVLSGPDWSGIHIKSALLRWWLSQVGETLNMVSVHHYAGDIFKKPTIEDLISEKHITQGMDNLRNLVKTAWDFKLPLRVTEAATLSYGGVKGVCDTAGSAIWILDTAMEVCHAGASGVNFHQSLKQPHNANYNAVDQLGGRVRVRLPFYGLLLLQQALSGGAGLVGRSIVGECKVWLLKAHKNGDLRALVLNKVDYKDCAVDVQLNLDQMRRFSDTADVDYLFASHGLYETWRIYLSGLTFDDWGTKDRRFVKSGLKVRRYEKKGKTGKVEGGGFAVSMMKGTKALLVTIPHKAKQTKG